MEGLHGMAFYKHLVLLLYGLCTMKKKEWTGMTTEMPMLARAAKQIQEMHFIPFPSITWAFGDPFHGPYVHSITPLHKPHTYRTPLWTNG